MTLFFFSAMAVAGLFTVLGNRLGRTYFPEESRGIATAIGAMLAIACFSLSGAAVYYTTTVNTITLGIAAIFTISAILFGTQQRYRRHAIATEFNTEQNNHSVSSLLLFGIGILSVAAWWQAILSAPILDAVRTPWSVLLPIAILAPAVALFASFILLHRGYKLLGTIALFTTLFSIFTSATILFPLGYGFDPFLHRATVAHIIEHGTITPKPLYYIGEYALELYGNILVKIPLFSLNILLVPLLAAITLTSIARRIPVSIAILLIGFANWISTTPQSLAYLFTVLAIISIPKSITLRQQLVAPSLFALAALITHPIAGVPACFFVALSATHLQHQSRARSILQWILGILAALALPAMFAIQAIISHASVSFTPERLWRLHELPLSGFLFSHGNTWLDALYLFSENASILILILAGIGFFIQQKTNNHRPDPIIALALLGSFIIVSLGIDFSYLIAYERQDFALRLFFLATLFALPSASDALKYFGDHFRAKSFFRPPFLFLGFIACCATVYGMYPRNDGYARSAAFNVSDADFNTVYAIHNRESKDADYIVLSNQATAAAALQEFGFRKYYHNDIFYYPIPTGGPLYQSYLSMVENEPTQATITKAMELAGVHKAYFVVSDYWWKSDAIIENTKQIIDTWFAVDGGKTTVFIFTDENIEQSSL